jgi:ABC-type branched-subunit amino acid transport system ATPase component/ABC-type branched-subunit amino acid transport system permease subunit
VIIAAVPHVPFTHFELPLPTLVTGLVGGLTYAMLGIGLTLTYKSSRVLNFAFGEIGAFASGLIPLLVFNYHLNYWLALFVALAAGTLISGLTEVFVIRRLRSASRLIVLIATIGMAQLLIAVANYLPQLKVSNGFYPTPFHASVRMGTVRLDAGELLILFVVPVSCLALGLFFAYARLGLASRAAAENLEAARLTGIPAQRISLSIWLIAGLLAAVAAVLIGPTQPIVTTAYRAEIAVGPMLLLRALAAAMIGGLGNLRRVFIGGVALGIVEALVTWNYHGAGIVELILLVTIIGSLFFQRSLGQAARGTEQSSWSLTGTIARLDPRLAATPAYRTMKRGVIIGALALAVFLPTFLSSGELVTATSVVVFGMIVLSLVLLTGFAGLVSLGQMAFVGLGALVAGRLVEMGYPYWIALLFAGISGGVAAFVVGLPALRIRGLFLAVSTLAFAVASSSWLFRQPWLVRRTATENSLQLPRFHMLGVDFQGSLQYYWLCLGVLVVMAVVVHLIRQSGAGRILMAVRDNEQYAATLSVRPRQVRLAAFVISGSMAGVAGFFYAGLMVNFPDLTVFSPTHSLEVLAMAVIGNVTMVSGALLGVLFVRGIPAFLNPVLHGVFGTKLQSLLAGAGLVLVLVQYPSGLVHWWLELRDRLLGRLAKDEVPSDVDAGAAGDRRSAAALLAAATASAATAVESATATATPAGDEVRVMVTAPVAVLEGRHLYKSFGGNPVIKDVSLSVKRGEILALLGPNGAGKTTLFDLLTGRLRPDSGQVVLDGFDITADRPEQRARMGIGRSFQEASLFEGLAVLDVMKVALERQAPSEYVPAMFGAPPSRHAEAWKERRAGELLDLLGLAPYRNRLVSELSTGMRRIVELGCLIGLGGDVLLLDEPSAGVAQREAEAMVPLLLQLRAYLDATMVLIDHDVPMVTSVADRVCVLSAGEVIAEGPPSIVRTDPAIVAAFLGTDERTIFRSGSRDAAGRDGTGDDELVVTSGAASGPLGDV